MQEMITIIITSTGDKVSTNAIVGTIIPIISIYNIKILFGLETF
jgi:hypothetical protein